MQEHGAKSGGKEGKGDGGGVNGGEGGKPRGTKVEDHRTGTEDKEGIADNRGGRNRGGVEETIVEGNNGQHDGGGIGIVRGVKL